MTAQKLKNAPVNKSIIDKSGGDARSLDGNQLMQSRNPEMYRASECSRIPLGKIAATTAEDSKFKIVSIVNYFFNFFLSLRLLSVVG